MSDGSGRRPRRASRPAPAGVDPRPAEHPLTARAAEDRPEAWGDAPADGAPSTGVARRRPTAHDAELLRDRPPHWG